jgi:hypothetical protein
MAALAREQWLRRFGLAALLTILVVWAVAPQAALAQEASATVNGVVSDPSGAAIPDAHISLTNVNTAVVRTTVANSSGAYAFLNVVPGVYKLEASATGFARVTQSAVTLEVNQTATFDFHLKIGESQQSVTVEATAAGVESSTSELGTVVNTQEVNNLPLNGRNFTELLTITPGVANVNRDQSGTGAGAGGGGFVGAAVGVAAFPAIDGARVRSNTYLLDGINDLNTFLTTYNFAPIIDDIQEFKTQNHNDEAEYGGVMGGIVSVVSKSGTNQYHGELWEFLRNSDMDARGFFNAALAPLRQNQFGAGFGGPISIPKVYNGKNRTFFYAAYEGSRVNTANEGGTLGPTTAERGGDFSALLATGAVLYDPNSTTYNAATNTYSRTPIPNNVIPSTEINPVSQLYQSLVPQAGALINGSNIYLANANILSNDTGQIRADQYIGNHDQLMFRYSQYEEGWRDPNGVIGHNNDDIYGHNWTIHETHTFGPTTVLEAYFGRNFGFDNEVASVSGMNASFLNQVNGLGMNTTFETLNGKEYAPMISSITGYLSWPNSALQGTEMADVWQWGGTLSKILGKHTIKVGADIQTNNFYSPIGYDTLSFSPAQTAGLGGAEQGVGGDAWASLLLGVPSGASLRNVHEVANGGWMDAVFIQDQWKASPRLTVNLGFRYDLRLWPIYGAGKDLYTGDADAVTGQYYLTALPPNCSATVGAPCLPNGTYVGTPASGDTIAQSPDPLGAGQLPEYVHVAGSNHAILNNDHGDWSGRVGLAYRISDKMVARAGYGRFYDMWGGTVQLAQNFGGNWPAVATINNPTLNQNTVTASMTNPLGLGGSGGLVYPVSTFSEVSQWMVDPNFKTPYMDQWNFGIQRELPSSTVLDVNYVGSVGRRLDWGPVQNIAVPGPGPVAERQPFPYMLPQWFDQSVGASRYNALQVSVKKTASQTLAFQISYTLSKSIDDGCGIGANCDIENVYNRTADVQISDTNQTNNFTASFTLMSPFGKSIAQGNKFVGTLAGGWAMNGILSLHSGQPYTVFASTAILNNGGLNNEWADQTGSATAGGQTQGHWFNVSSFANPAAYTYGTEVPNSLTTQFAKNLDLSIFRQFHVGSETRYFEFRAEAYNLFNSVIFGIPNSNIGSPNPGVVTGPAGATLPRQLQMALKFYF